MSGASTYYEGSLGKGLAFSVRILDWFSCRTQGTFQVQLRRLPRLDKRLRMSFERCQLKLQAWVSCCGEDMGKGGGRRPQEPAFARHHDEKGLGERHKAICTRMAGGHLQGAPMYWAS